MDQHVWWNWWEEKWLLLPLNVVSSQPLFGEDHPPGFVPIGAGSDYAADLLLGCGRKSRYDITL